MFEHTNSFTCFYYIKRSLIIQSTIAFLICTRLTLPICSQSVFDRTTVTILPIYQGVFKSNSLSIKSSKHFRIPLQSGFGLRINYEIVLGDAFSLITNFGGKKNYINITNKVLNPLNESDVVERFKGQIKYSNMYIGVNSSLALNKIKICTGININKSLNKASNIISNYGSIYSIFNPSSNESAIFETKSLNMISLIEDYYLTYSSELSFSISNKSQLLVGVLIKPTSKYNIYEYTLNGHITRENETIPIKESVLLSTCWTDLFIGINFKL